MRLQLGLDANLGCPALSTDNGSVIVQPEGNATAVAQPHSALTLPASGFLK